MTFIDQHDGRFVTIMPGSRLEDSEFRPWIVNCPPHWQLRDDPNSKDPAGPRERTGTDLAFPERALADEARATALGALLRSHTDHHG